MSPRFKGISALLLGITLPAVPRDALASDSDKPAPIPLRVALLNETIALPSATRMFASFNPGVEIGTEISYEHTPRYDLFQSIDAGFFHHDGFATSAFVASAFGFRPTLFEGLFAEISVGAGYLAHFSALSIHDIGADGQFRRSSPWLHRFIAQPSVAIGYRIGLVAAFVGYGVMVEIPFFENYSVVLPHQMIKLGARVDLLSFFGKK